MSKVQNLINRVNFIVDTSYNSLSKAWIGDSIANNRTPSVRQVIRYLTNIGYSKEAKDLTTVYTKLLDRKLFKKLRQSNYRSDAFDINELQRVINRYADPALKGQLARVMRNNW